MLLVPVNTIYHYKKLLESDYFCGN